MVTRLEAIGRRGVFIIMVKLYRAILARIYLSTVKLQVWAILCLRVATTPIRNFVNMTYVHRHDKTSCRCLPEKCLTTCNLSLAGE